MWWWRSAKEQRFKLSLLAPLNTATSLVAPISTGLYFFSLSPWPSLSHSLTHSLILSVFRTPKPNLFSYLAFSSICLVIIFFHYKIYFSDLFFFFFFFNCCYRFHFTSKILLVLFVFFGMSLLYVCGRRLVVLLHLCPSCLLHWNWELILGICPKLKRPSKRDLRWNKMGLPFEFLEVAVGS